MYLSICGVPGVGKTTFAELMSQRLGSKFLPEDPSHFPLVKNAFENPTVWGYANQLQFVVSKINDQLGLLVEQQSILQELDALATHALWTPVLQHLGHITHEDAQLLDRLIQMFLNTPLRRPDLYLFLRCPADTVITRVHARNREYEMESDQTETLIRHIDIAMWRFYDTLGSKKLIVDVGDIDFRIKNRYSVK